MENNINTIILRDEENNEVEFELIMKFDIEDSEYVIVAPTEGDEVEAVAFKIDKDDKGEDIFVTIDDEDEFEMVTEAYETLCLEQDKLN
ncbi:DUF1292 domain-containing protein [Clostridium aestuarii]|uniref:UPF0473 protein OW763_06720 n=1 Tax=Clostridium aestuarii TaxID=338193 RepID=A0ABT4D1Z1_9CLOT|nr:DUF1292 domain-containing protein [Clostridium aestuarii]MCY6484043.1 DUF1292 domain-containing protein [Clostridium aestuarii]